MVEKASKAKEERCHGIKATHPRQTPPQGKQRIERLEVQFKPEKKFQLEFIMQFEIELQALDSHGRPITASTQLQ